MRSLDTCLLLCCVMKFPLMYKNLLTQKIITKWNVGLPIAYTMDYNPTQIKTPCIFIEWLL